MKEKEIWGRVEFLWDKVNGRLIYFDLSLQSRTDQRTSYIRFSLFQKKRKLIVWRKCRLVFQRIGNNFLDGLDIG